MPYVASLSVGNAAIAVVAAALAFYELMIHRRDPSTRDHAWLSAVCFTASLHAWAVFAHYNAPLAWIPTINRLEGSALVVLSHSIVAFAAARSTRALPFPGRWLALSAAAWVVVVWLPFTVTGIELRPMWGLPHPFPRRVDNAVVLTGYVWGYALALFGVFWLHRYGRGVRRRGVVIALALCVTAVLVDILSGLVLEQMLPLMLQYGVLAILISLVREHAAGYVQMLQATERDFRHVLDASPDAIAVFHDRATVYANPAFEELFGHPATDDVLEQVHPDDRDQVAEELSDHGQRARSEQVRWRHREGHWLDVDMLVIDAKFERQPATIAILRDASARKELQARMMEMDRMTAVGTLAAGVGHEINNPLSYALLNLTEAQQAANEAPVDPSQVQSLLRSAQDGVERVAEIVRSLRSMAITEGEAQAVRLDEIITSAVTLTRNEIEHRARLVTSFDEVPLVVANAGRLSQVFVNLLLNAAQAIPEGDPQRNRVTLRLRHDERGVRFEVEDTGPGVVEGREDEIFEPFVTTKAGRGSGLGLSICRSTMHAMGGELSVSRGEAGGALFVGVIPPAAVLETAPSSDPDDQVSRQRLRGRLLLVEDERELLRALRRQLGRFAQVDGFESAPEALEAIAREAPYDLVVTDIMMPEMSGTAFYREVRARAPELAERFVFVTGGAFTPEAKAFCASVDRPVLHKPVAIDELLGLLDEQLNASSSGEATPSGSGSLPG